MLINYCHKFARTNMEYYWTLIWSLLAGAVGLYYFIYQKMNYFKKKGIPYIKPMPILGNMGPSVFQTLSAAEHIQQLYNTQPDVKYVGIFHFMNPAVLLRDPELIKSVTVKNFDNFQDHRNIMDEVQDPLFTKSLFLLHGDRWRDMRSLLSPTFTSSKMKMMFKLVSQCGIDLTNYLIVEAAIPIDMEMRDTFTRYTNDVIATSAFGINIDSLKDKDNQFYKMSKKATTSDGIRNAKLLFLILSPFLARLFGIKIFSDDIDKFFNHVIESTIALREEKGIVRNDMIQLMMQARDRSEKIKLTNQDIAAQAFIFIFGGFDSSSLLLCFAAHEIGINPAIQKKLQAEIDQVLAENQGEVTYESLHSMQYLDAVISETLRLYPPFPTMDRVCNKAFELPPAAPGFLPHTMEIGSVIQFPIYGMHRDPQYFPDPEKFDPERFSEKNKQSIPPYAYFPFGLGPRSCIGYRFALMEAKVGLFHLFAKCNLSPSSKTSIPMVLDKKNFNTSSANGFWLKISRRS